MKLFSFLSFISICCAFQSHAQDCEPYIPMDQGTKFEMKSYNDKGKLQSRSMQKVISKSVSNGDIIAKIHNELFDKKDKQISVTDYTIKCIGGVFQIDMMTKMNYQDMSQYQGMEMKVDGDFMNFPSNPTPGQTLPDNNISVSFGPVESPMPVATIKVKTSNRKVEKFETLTTPAGTFECIKFTMDIHSQVGTVIPIKVEAKSAEWYCKRVGLVKSESFNKKGTRTGYSELTTFKK